MSAFLVLAGCPHSTVTRYRCLHLQEQLALHGHSAVIYEGREEEPALLGEVANYTALVLQRVAMGPTLRYLIQHFQAQHKPVIFDTDDLVFEPALTAWHRGVKNLTAADQELYHDGVQRYLATLQASDYVLTATPLLAELAERRGKRAFVQRNALGNEMQALADQLYAVRQQRPASERVIIGYGSGTPTHDVDFAETTTALVDILTRHAHVELWVAGPLQLDPALARLGKRVRRLPLTDWRGWFELVSHFDINLAPLEMGNLFCRAKSEIKFVEAAAMGIPTIASRIDPFEDAIQPGENGLLASHPVEWIEALEHLVTQPDLRRTLGKAARQTVAQRYSPTARAADLARLLPVLLNSSAQPDMMPTYQPESVASLTTTATPDSPITPIEQAAEPSHEDTTPAPKHSALRGALWAPHSAFPAAPFVPLTLNWLISEPVKGSGGHTNLLRLIKHLVEFGHDCHVYIIPMQRMHDYTLAQIRAFLEENFPPTGAQIHRWQGRVQPADATLATYWKTVAELNKLAAPGKTYYVVQDFEPYFFAMSSDYLSAENTYRLGHHCITLGRWLAGLLENNYAAQADYFDFAVDTAIYHPYPTPRSPAPRVAFYARPSTPRRAYELGLEALALVKARLPETEIIFYGANELTPPPPFPVVNLGVVNEYALASLYSTCDVGLVLSLTNPSLVPFEMMACRCAVVDMRSERLAGMLTHGETAMLADPLPERLADAVLQLLRDQALRERIVEQAYQFVQQFSWERSARQLEAVLLRHAPPPAQRYAQKRLAAGGVDALVWQIQQLLTSKTDKEQQLEQLRKALNQALVEKAQLLQQLQQTEDAYNELRSQQPIPPLQQARHYLSQQAQTQAPIWQMGKQLLHKLLLSPGPIRQTFTAEQVLLSRLELLFARQADRHGGAFHFALYHAAAEPVLLLERTIWAAEIEPDRPFAIDFPTQIASEKQNYYFTLAPTAGDGQHLFALWRFPVPVQPNAQLYRGAQRESGQVAFQPYYGHPHARQPGQFGGADWGQTIRFRTTVLNSTVKGYGAEARRLAQKSWNLLQQQGLGGVLGETARYIEWRMKQRQARSK